QKSAAGGAGSRAGAPHPPGGDGYEAGGANHEARITVAKRGTQIPPEGRRSTPCMQERPPPGSLACDTIRASSNTYRDAIVPLRLCARYKRRERARCRQAEQFMWGQILFRSYRALEGQVVLFYSHVAPLG